MARDASLPLALERRAHEGRDRVEHHYRQHDDRGGGELLELLLGGAWTRRPEGQRTRAACYERLWASDRDFHKLFTTIAGGY
jgi:hypothetical protein